MQNSWPKLPDPGQLPKRELNPLLNPLLEQNLGRWAQVYFTNSPETRERAVLELLRELDSQASAGVQPPPPATQGASTPPVTESVLCSACDGENRPQQRFCGFCGSPLRSRESAVPPQSHFAAPSGEQSWEPETLSVLGLSSFRQESPRQESDLQFLRMKDFGSEYYKSGPNPLRRYLLAGMAVLLVAVAYMGWPHVRAHLPSALRSLAAGPSAPATSLQPQPAVPQSTEPVEPPPSSAQSQQPSEPVQPSQPQSPQPREATREITDPSPSVAPGPVPASLASRTRSVPLPSDSAAPRGAVDGTQELLLAQRYLDGKGTPPDPATAARWLWKAVGKQNPRAALLLADLYTRGDGVSKSCAQARILLGVAANKGVHEAAPRLRSLEASGCR